MRGGGGKKKKQGKSLCFVCRLSSFTLKQLKKKISGLKRRGKEADVEHRNTARGSTAHPFSPG